MKNLAIIGSGDLGKLIAYHGQSQYDIVGFYDDFQAEAFVEGFPVLGKISNILVDYQNKMFDELIIAIGYNHFDFREKVFNKFHGNIAFATITHSSSYVDDSCIIGPGTVILPGCTLDRNVELGSNVLLNTGVTIAHDSKIYEQSFISPGVSIAGFVKIGRRCNIGIGSMIVDNISICDDVQTGGGTVVINNLEKSGLYVGNPARFIR